MEQEQYLMPGNKDFDFAKKYNLEITRVVSDKKENGY